MTRFSIIIPVLNEEHQLRRLLPYLTEIVPGCEIIVADGNSADRSVEVAQAYGTVVHAPRGRGVQMNRGAAHAAGDILWFIHADTRPHPDSTQAIAQALEGRDVVGGGFVYALNDPAFRFRVIEFMSNAKNRRLNLLYGDMAIFVRRPVFERMGGYAEIPLMEDMDFSRRLKAEGKVLVLPQVVKTSARRWREEGYIKCSLRSWLLQSAWSFGVSPDKLARWYRFR